MDRQEDLSRFAAQISLEKATELSSSELVYSCQASRKCPLGYTLVKAGRWAHRSQGIRAYLPAEQQENYCVCYPTGRATARCCIRLHALGVELKQGTTRCCHTSILVIEARSKTDSHLNQ